MKMRALLLEQPKQQDQRTPYQVAQVLIPLSSCYIKINHFEYVKNH